MQDLKTDSKRRHTRKDETKKEMGNEGKSRKNKYLRAGSGKDSAGKDPEEENGEIDITTRTIPGHLIFYGLPKNKEGRYTRLKFIKPLAQNLTLKHTENYGLNEALVKMCTPKPENTFEKELENTIIEIEEMYSRKVQEWTKMLKKAGLEYPLPQE